MLKLKEFSIKRRTDRDLEIPVLLEFLGRISAKVETALDVGGQYSNYYYLQELRKIAGVYEVLDPLPDPETEKLVDRYIQKDGVTYEYNSYDLLICVSTLEHVGQYPIKYKDYRGKRMIMFKKMLKAAKKYFWISFPVGLDYIDPGEMTLINKNEFIEFEKLVKPYKYTIGFFYSDGPQAGQPWGISTKEKCLNLPYLEFLGNRAICVIEVRK